MPGKDLCLLALDGGGIRGLSSLQILKQLMESINPQSPPKPYDYFDMIGGTSTGGLIAIMLGRLRMSVDDCIEAYASLSDKVFQKKRQGISILGKVQARFDSKELENAIKQVIEKQGLEIDSPLEGTPDTSCKVFVCAIRKETGKPVHLRSYWSPRGDGRALRPKIWEAARATSAASSFFEPIKIGSMGQEFVDGATGANNPVYELWNEAQDVWNEAGRLDDNIKCLVSIGTGCPSVRSFGDNFVEIGKSLMALSTETEKTAENFARDKRHLFVEGRYFRFNVNKGLESISFEDSQQKNAVVSATSDYLESQEIYNRMQSFSLLSKSSATPSDTETYHVHAGLAAYHAKEWTQAITLLKQALEGGCNLGLDSARVAQIRRYYAQALYLKGENVSASDQFEIIVLWAEKEFGPEHNETLRSRMSWGYALEACHLSIPAGKQYKLAALGFEHASNNADTLDSLRARYRHGMVASEHEAYDLAWPYWAEAEESLRRAAKGFATLFKPENDEAFEAQKGYATVLLKMCRDKDALSCFKSLLLVATQKRRPLHTQTIKIIKRNIKECEFWLSQPLAVRTGDRLHTARKRAQKQWEQDNWQMITGHWERG